MPTFSFRPSLTFSGRKFKGLRGWAGKPLHPPLTDIPIGAYTLAAAFDVLSIILGDRPVAFELYRAATFTMLGGSIAGVAAMLTGFWDYIKSTPKGTQARRTTNAHGMTMLVMQITAFVTLWLRIFVHDDVLSAPLVVVVLSVVILLLATIGGAIGGELVFDYGFNVETSGDAAVWHPSEHDVLPGDADHPAQKPDGWQGRSA